MNGQNISKLITISFVKNIKIKLLSFLDSLTRWVCPSAEAKEEKIEKISPSFSDRVQLRRICSTLGLEVGDPTLLDTSNNDKAELRVDRRPEELSHVAAFYASSLEDFVASAARSSYTMSFTRVRMRKKGFLFGVDNGFIGSIFPPQQSQDGGWST